FIDSPHKVYAGNLGWTVTSEVLKQAFAGQPGYLSAKVSYERDTGRSRGFGFVSFETAEDAEAALNTMNGVVSLRVFMHHLLLLCFVPNFHCRIL
ncbi:RNA-binding protein CP33, chloroplastic, partial [Linum perenne]